jgi:hypothetical protein
MMKKAVLVLLVVLAVIGLYARPAVNIAITDDPDSTAGDGGSHFVLTVYLIPAKVPYDWSSPDALLHSYFKNFKRNIFSKNGYILGHAFVQLSAGSAENDILTGMRSVDRKSQRHLVLGEHYGLSILGTALPGELDEQHSLGKKVERYLQQGKIAFIRMLISREAYDRMMAYYASYKLRLDSLGNPGLCYGGAFWPRYYGEGSGCSAFAISFMDLAGLFRSEYSKWKVYINIPDDLLGGPCNNGNEVRLKDIRKSDGWGKAPEKEGTGYEPFWLYDPTLMYEWVLKTYEQDDSVEKTAIRKVNIERSKGIEIDARHIPLPDESIFMKRKEPSIFIGNQGEKHSK